MRHRYSLRQILVVTFTAICVVPVATLAVWLHFGIKAHALDEARDKNQLLSQNLAMPIGTYLLGARQTLASLGIFLDHPDDPAETAKAFQQQHYFRAVLVLTPAAIQSRWSPTADVQSARGDSQLLALATPFFEAQGPAQSGVVRNPYSGRPTVLFTQPLGGKLVVGLLDLNPVIELGRQVKFGVQGHAAITDQHGNIVLHPNSKWINEIRSIADWPIIQSGMQGKTGVATFYSPFVKKDMVAGYAAVPEFNWVIITPQPLDEFQARANALLRTAALVAAIGMAIALVLAAIISGWIARPIAALAKAVQRLPNNGYQDEFEDLAKIAPRELDTLQRRSKLMAKEVRNAIAQRDRMNDELANLVERATRGLQDANKKLSQQALVDDLTKLHNRRALWQRISDMERAQPDSYLPVQVLLFDLDNFKEVNDTLGHAAGDQVLMHVAAVLEQETREGDFVVRYGGDEFLVVMHHCSTEIAQERADTICCAVHTQPLTIDKQLISIRMSVGIAESESKLSRPSFDELLKAADMAMYAAKAKNKQRDGRLSA